MKISGYHKDAGDEVILKTDYSGLDSFDRVYISKVFTDTDVPEFVLKFPNVIYGGTGFYYDKAPQLPDEVEHHMPDYHLYDEWISDKLIEEKNKRSDFKYYLDYSIGFLTRGCFRKCDFCVNKNYNRVHIHSPLSEFLDPARPKICLLDDNFLGCGKWKSMIGELIASGKPFQFKQGLDERLLTDEKCAVLFGCRYDGDYIFAFDNVKDATIIEEKLKMLRRHTSVVPKFYCFTGYDRENRWDDRFWAQDIFDLFTRIEILMRYRCLPYIMRFERYVDSPFRGVYITIARWCNQPSFYKKKSLREYASMDGNATALRYISEFEQSYPEVSYFYDIKYGGELDKRLDRNCAVHTLNKQQEECCL